MTDNTLSFKTLRDANVHRIPTFKNAKGGRAHKKRDGSDWNPAQWLQALTGELGEYANKRKKFERGDITFEEFKVEAAKELADVQIYLDLLALRCLDHDDYVDPKGIDLAQASVDKFNEVSVRVGSPVFIGTNEETHYVEYRYDDSSDFGQIVIALGKPPTK